MRCCLYLRRCIPALVAVLALVTPTYAQEAQPSLSPGFQRLTDAAPEEVGAPVASEHAGDREGSTAAETTTGLLYWQPGLLPTWTDGKDRLTLNPAGEIIRWAGDSLGPPPPPAPVQDAMVVPGYSPAPGTGWPIGGALGSRIYCIEGIESTHGAHMYNPVGLVWPDGIVRHAQGWLGWMGPTAADAGAIVGNRASEWAAAARMLLGQVKGHKPSEFAGVASGAC